MAKYPAPGRVKTRLAAALGAEPASALARAFILDLAARLAALPYAVTWACWPPEAPFATLVPGARCIPQQGADLGERMAAAIVACAAGGERPVIVVGTDMPHLPASAVEAAWRALATGADVVLGPATDGGYYLIGVARPLPALFHGITWGGDDVFATTCRRAAEAGLTVALLPEGFDVDDLDGLRRLHALVAASGVDLPETTHVLRRVFDAPS